MGLPANYLIAPHKIWFFLMGSEISSGSLFSLSHAVCLLSCMPLSCGHHPLSTFTLWGIHFLDAKIFSSALDTCTTGQLNLNFCLPVTPSLGLDASLHCFYLGHWVGPCCDLNHCLMWSVVLCCFLCCFNLVFFVVFWDDVVI